MDYPIEIIEKQINKEYLGKFLNNPFKDMIKFVVDLDKEIITFGGELHSDAQELLVSSGSDTRNTWGGNLFLSKDNTLRIEYVSFINIKPLQDNFTIDIKDKDICTKIESLLKKKIIDL